MKKVIRTIALMGVLGLMTVGCQKELVVNPTVTEDNVINESRIEYSVDGTTYNVTLPEEERSVFFLRLVTLARENGRVVVKNANSNECVGFSKEVLTYTTTSAEDAANWANDKTRQGYEVTINYNNRTGVYTCIAIR